MNSRSPLLFPQRSDLHGSIRIYLYSYSCGMNLHIKQLAGNNNHHIIEGIFKAFAKALDEATQYDKRIEDVLSTKGSL